MNGREIMQLLKIERLARATYRINLKYHKAGAACPDNDDKGCLCALQAALVELDEIRAEIRAGSSDE